MKRLLHILFILFAQISFGQGQPPIDTPQINSLEATAMMESSLKIFPNPAKNLLTINMRIPSINQARLSLHDMLGNEVELLADDASGVFEKTFHIDGVRAGIYFVRINYNNGQSTIVRKIVIQ